MDFVGPPGGLHSDFYCFRMPVTEAEAPGYHAVIKHPMDFGTMKGGQRCSCSATAACRAATLVHMSSLQLAAFQHCWQLQALCQPGALWCMQPRLLLPAAGSKRVAAIRRSFCRQG